MIVLLCVLLLLLFLLTLDARIEVMLVFFYCSATAIVCHHLFRCFVSGEVSGPLCLLAAQLFTEVEAPLSATLEGRARMSEKGL